MKNYWRFCTTTKKTDSMFIEHTYPTGLRAVATRFAQSNVEYFGIAVNAGSAAEDESRHGLAHFVEHCIFKGTSHHTATYIINHIEETGGELNAYTNKEETVVYSITPRGNLGRSIRLIFDIVNNASFPEPELDKERLVISEEIDSYLDNPAEAVFDDFDERLLRSTPLAHNILGTKQTIGTFNTQICKEWLENRFVPANAVVFYSGPLEPDKALKEIDKVFCRFTRTAAPQPLGKLEFQPPFHDVIDRDLYHQCHAALGYRVPGIDHESTSELLLLTNILGGPGLNSKLNMALREKRGLVYTVEASTSFFTQTGETVIYFGCDKDNLKRCLAIIHREIDSLEKIITSPKELEKAKRQFLGQLAIAHENREQSVMSAARSVLCRGRVLTGAEFRQRIAAITPQSMVKALEYLAPGKESTLILK